MAKKIREDEIWRNIPGLEGYEVSNAGRVRSKETDMIIEAVMSKDYPMVDLGFGRLRVHILVAEAFLDPVKGCTCVMHKDGDATNNNVENLEFVPYAKAREIYKQRSDEKKKEKDRVVLRGFPSREVYGKEVDSLLSVENLNSDIGGYDLFNIGGVNVKIGNNGRLPASQYLVDILPVDDKRRRQDGLLGL